MIDWKKELNAEQYRVATHSGSHVQVVATPGSGKTRSLTYRAAYLLTERAVPAHRMLLTTFTNKAAGEIKERLNKLAGPEKMRGMWIGTFHSICVRLIRAYGQRFGLPPKFQILDQKQAESLIGRVLKELKLPPEDAAAYGRDVSRLKDDGLWAEDEQLIQQHRLSAAGGQRDQMLLARVYRRYQQLVREGGALDFGDLLLWGGAIVQDEQLQPVLRGKFSHVLVDEAQDTNGSQYNFIRSLSLGSQHEVCIVGDEDQCSIQGTVVTTDLGEIPVEKLNPQQHKIVPWQRHSQRATGTRAFRIASRRYVGPVVMVSAAGRTTGVTPNHRFLCRWEDRSSKACAVYMMYRPDLGWRVGWCQMFKADGAAHFAHRVRVETAPGGKPPLGWILKTFEDRTQASIYESYVAAQWGLPTSLFEPNGGRQDALVKITPETIKQLFSMLDREAQDERARACLLYHDRDPALPFYPYPDTAKRNRPRATYFECFAANLLPGFMAIPLPDGQNIWSPITGVPRRAYSGHVYSLDVTKDHSYIADGLVTLNSIYGWRGADLTNLMRFAKEFPNVQQIVMAQNYRSTGAIVSSADRLIRHNSERYDKKIFTANKEGVAPTVKILPDDQTEARWVAQQVQQALQQKVPPNEIAILYRGNQQSLNLEEALRAQRVPYFVVGGFKFFDRSEIRDILSYLRLLVNPSSDVDFERVINCPPRGLGDVAVKKIGYHAGETGLPMPEAARSLVTSGALTNLQRAGCEGFLTVYDELRRGLLAHETPPLKELLLEIVRATGYRAHAMSAKDGKGRERMDNLTELAESAHDRQQKRPKLTAQEWLQEIALWASDDEKARESCVTLSTCHSVKGLEFKQVFLIGCADGIIPHQRSIDGGSIQEERRLMYVAITRARERFTASLGLRGRSNTERLPSRFLYEAGILQREKKK